MSPFESASPGGVYEAARLSGPLRLRDTFQEEMANYVGISQDHLSKIERGKGAPTIETLFLLSEKFRKSIDWILRGEGN